MDNIFIPSVVLIANITNAQYPTVTFVQDHNFFDNEYVSFRVTRPYGMVEINNQRAKVISHDAISIVIDLNTTNYTPFTTPVNIARTTPPCAVPSSSGVNLALYSPTMILEDCFDNVPLN